MSPGGKIKYKLKVHVCGDFPGGPVAKNPPSNAGDSGSIPGQGTEVPHDAGQLSPRSTTTEPASLNERAHALWSPRATTREKPVHCHEDPTCLNEDPACHNEDPMQPNK